MKKILVLTSTFPKSLYDEVPMFVYDQLSSLEKKYSELKFTVFVPHYYDKKEIDKSMRIIQKRYHYFWPFSFEKLVGRGILSAITTNKFNILLIPFFIFFQILNTIIFIHTHRPDIIYAHWFFPQALTALVVKKIYKIPYVFTTHAFDAEVMKKIPILGNQLTKSIIRNSESYTSDSVNAEQKLHSFLKNDEIDESKSLVIPMPLEFRENLDISFQVQESINNMKKSNKNLLFIGRFAEKKGIEDLLLIFLKLKRLDSGVNLYLAGNGPKVNEYKKFVSKNNLTDSVYFLGYVNSTEKLELYNNSDLVIIPSIKTKIGDQEGLPVVVLESLSRNTVTIASHQSNAGEIIRHGENGFLFDPERTDEAVKIIKNILVNDKTEYKLLIKNANELGGKYTSLNLAKKFYNHLFNF
jgi:glycosyltransferase involved in cell wall biosynthesis